MKPARSARTAAEGWGAASMTTRMGAVAWMMCLGVSGLSAGTATPALAQVSEARVAIMAHNIRVIDPKNADKEDGPNVEAEILFDSPDFLSWAGSPRPGFVGSLNTAGETSFVGVTLEWRFMLGEKVSFDPFLGYAIHDGDPLDNPFPPSDSVNRQRFNDEELALGSRDQFRIGFAFGYALSERWTAYGVFEHLSHGQILGKGKNQGLDNVGLRIGRSF
jgi:lipid A 3-O-deacylase